MSNAEIDSMLIAIYLIGLFIGLVLAGRFAPGNDASGDCGAGIGWFFAAAYWPLALPFAVAGLLCLVPVYIGSRFRPQPTTKPERDEGK